MHRGRGGGLRGSSTRGAPSTSRSTAKRVTGPLHRAFGVAGPLVPLVRPDGHIAFRGRGTGDLPALRTLLDRFLVPAGAPAAPTSAPEEPAA